MNRPVEINGVLWCCERGEELVDIEFTALVTPGYRSALDRYGQQDEPDQSDEVEIIGCSIPMTEEETRLAEEKALKQFRA